MFENALKGLVSLLWLSINMTETLFLNLLFEIVEKISGVILRKKEIYRRR